MTAVGDDVGRQARATRAENRVVRFIAAALKAVWKTTAITKARTRDVAAGSEV